MALVHIPLENGLHARLREKMKKMGKEGKPVTWETLIREWGEAWLQSDVKEGGSDGPGDQAS